MKIRPVAIQRNYHLSTESASTIAGWLIEEVANFKLRPQEYVEPVDTERILRTICKEMCFSYDGIVDALTESESEVVSDL